MAGVPLELPTIQNWNCHNCSGCCRQHGIHITDADKERIERQNWTAADGVPADRPVFVRMGRWPQKPWWRLAHQPDGACVFLNEQGLCRIHAKFGEEAKPLACRIYPYAFHPAGKNVVVSLRFSCPSVVANAGRPVTAQRGDLKELASLVVPPNVSQARPPLISPGSRVEWADFQRFVAMLDGLLATTDEPVLSRLVVGLAVVEVIEQAQFDKLTGPRLDDFLGIVCEGVAADLPEVIAWLWVRSIEAARAAS